MFSIQNFLKLLSVWISQASLKRTMRSADKRQTFLGCCYWFQFAWYLRFWWSRDYCRLACVWRKTALSCKNLMTLYHSTSLLCIWSGVWDISSVELGYHEQTTNYCHENQETRNRTTRRRKYPESTAMWLEKYTALNQREWSFRNPGDHQKDKAKYTFVVLKSDRWSGRDTFVETKL